MAQIIKLTKEIEYKYENFLKNNKSSLLYYSLKYRNFLIELLDCKAEYLIAVDTDKIRGVLPLMSTKSGKYGKVLNSLPYYGSNGGIIADNKNIYELLLKHYQGMTENISASVYITNPLQQDHNPVLKYDLIDKRIGQWTDISDTENIMQSFDSSARRNIRKAINSRVKVFIDSSKIDDLKKIHQDNMNSMGGKAKTDKFFQLINKHFEQNKDYKIYIATINDQIIGALLLFYYNNIVEYYTPAVVEEYRSFQALPLIVYQAMIDASLEGFKWWNWGGTWLTQDGVYKFKKKFGAVDKEYKYFIKINNKEIYNSTKAELLSEYDNFYIIPFDKLKE